MQISRLATARIKIHQISCVIFETKSQFFFKLCITLQCHGTKLLFTLSSTYLYALDKRTQSKSKFSDFQLLTWKLTKFLMSFFKPKISFHLNFATPFSVMTHYSCKIVIKRVHQCTIFRLLGALMKVHPIPLPFLKPQGQALFKFCITVQCYER